MPEASEEIPRPIGLLIVAAISAVVTVLLAGRMPPSLESFREIFKSFGVDPGAAANFVMDAPYVWWVLGLASIALLIWIGGKSRVSIQELRRMKVSVTVLIIATVLSYGFVAYAIHVPIFKLGGASP